MAQPTRLPVPYVLITLTNAENDAAPPGETPRKIEKLDNNGRKVFATAVMQQFGEKLITEPVWKAPQVFPTGNGGIEIATFTEFSSQDRHIHEKGWEIYTVLRGNLEIYIDDNRPPVSLAQGDEIVIPPGTVHQVVRPDSPTPVGSGPFQLLVRVHSISCYGVDDKYVQTFKDGPWVKWSDLSKDQQANAYKLVPDLVDVRKK